MDPVLFTFLTAAAVAIIILATAHLYIYLIQRKTTKDNFTQTNIKCYRTASTFTQKKQFRSTGSQVLEKKCETKDQGCDANIIPYGATVTEQVKEYRRSHNNLEEVFVAQYRQLEIQVEQFTKDNLEQSIHQCTGFQKTREDIAQQLEQFSANIKEEIRSLQVDTQNNLHKLQESLYYEVERSTNSVVQQLLTIPPPPPRPWLYLPYGRQTRSNEAYRECKACQDRFWSHHRQATEIQTTETPDDPPPESEDAQSLD